jgi:hypothetical protein
LIRCKNDLCVFRPAARANIFIRQQANLACGTNAIAAGLAYAFVEVEVSAASRTGGYLDDFIAQIKGMNNPGALATDNPHLCRALSALLGISR